MAKPGPMEELKLNLIQSYIKEINDALKDAKEEDIMVLFKDLYDKEQRFAKRLRSTGDGRNVYMKFIRKISPVAAVSKSPNRISVLVKIPT